jgi:adenine-specific DNA-methyltransferase
MPDHYDDYTRDELIRLLRERDRKPKFGLVWERDEIEHERTINDDFVALDFDPGLSCGAAPFRNLIIEGDNFDALRFLRMTHAGQVKCIYIDPPYNTGNRDFIYNDRFVDKEDTYKHSKWLEFMYRRLELAKELLAEDGVIFVSIDDGEACHLKLLMDSLFGVSAFIGQLVWKSRQNKDNRSNNGASVDHEYVLTYGNKLRGVERDHNQFKNPDGDIRGPWNSGNMVGLADEKARPNLHYDLINPTTGFNFGKPKQGWRFDRERMASLIAGNRILWPEKATGRPRLKVFIKEMKSDFTGFSSMIGDQIFTYHGTRELDDIFADRVFDFPKPSDLILDLIRQGVPGKNDIVLDFFAGSGTTAHAVLKLNQEDGGNRRFILVSSTEATTDAPDKNLCRDVCAERVRRVISGYRNKKGEPVEGLGGDFAYLRARRIPAELILSRIEHEQVWTALQLIHTETLWPFDSTALIQSAAIENGAMLYVPKVSSEATMTAIKQAIDNAGTAVIYSWQPGLLNQHIEDHRASFQPIPQFLVNRFSLGARP